MTHDIWSWSSSASSVKFAYSSFHFYIILIVAVLWSINLITIQGKRWSAPATREKKMIRKCCADKLFQVWDIINPDDLILWVWCQWWLVYIQVVQGPAQRWVPTALNDQVTKYLERQLPMMGSYWMLVVWAGYQYRTCEFAAAIFCNRLPSKSRCLQLDSKILFKATVKMLASHAAIIPDWSHTVVQNW